VRTAGAAYQRYRIATVRTPEIVPLPPRFRVKVSKPRLIGLVLKELLELRGNVRAALDRPCVYGVFSGRLGGLAPREELCVGCLRCTVQYPEVVQIYRNPERGELGDPRLGAEDVDTILYEARTGRVPVRGAGYRGKFGGARWDGMWLDMSEIVRPTRDGIHGREFISTEVDVGEKPPFLRLDGTEAPRLLSIQVPFVFDLPPDGAPLEILTEAAARIETLAIVPLKAGVPAAPHVVPLVTAADSLDLIPGKPAMIELDGWDEGRFGELRRRFPDSLVCVRVPADADVVALAGRGARILHLVAGEAFLGDLIRRAHDRLVEAGIREEVTLLGSGGILMAEHVPKAIACGLDAVGLDVAPCVALQGRLRDGRVELPPHMTTEWGVQRIANLAGSWRDQLLEVLGAMGLREVRRLRGELGRCMFQQELEREAFVEIEGYGAHA
jgi:glutamate synthase-like protein